MSADGPAVIPQSVEVQRESGVSVVFADGHRCRFELQELRANCPCAGCRSQRDRGEQAWPRPGSPAELRIDTAELMGNWGLGISWSDGHSTGIYPWDILRRWCEDRGEDGQGEDGQGEDGQGEDG